MESKDGEITYARMMVPDDANPAGNVHGGTILKMIEIAGTIVAIRHVNGASKQINSNSSSDDSEAAWGAVVRLERMDFFAPMFIGELARLRSKLLFTSEHSMLVSVTVIAEHLQKGTVRVTNQAKLWYVGFPDTHHAPWKSSTSSITSLPTPVSVPQLTLTPEEEEKGRTCYLATKLERVQTKEEVLRKEPDGYAEEKNENHSDLLDEPIIVGNSHQVHPVEHSTETLAQVMLPSDCNVGGLVTGGTIMKLMDTCAGVCAGRHCRTNIVTACIDAIDFVAPVFNADLVYVSARINFVSSRSIEIQVTVESESARRPGAVRKHCNSARFTFVSLDEEGNTKPVPGLELRTQQEMESYEAGKIRYEARKRARAQAQKQHQQGEERKKKRQKLEE